MAGTGCRRPAVAASTSVAPGAGALLVPSVFRPDSEPQALVFRGDERVVSSPNSARIIVGAGAYLVRVGSGPVSQMVSVPVDVQAGATTVVPVRWGGLRIEVVDESNLPHSGVYELIRVADRQPTRSASAPTRCRAAAAHPVDGATVLAPEGGLVHYRLVHPRGEGRLRPALRRAAGTERGAGSEGTVRGERDRPDQLVRGVSTERLRALHPATVGVAG